MWNRLEDRFYHGINEPNWQEKNKNKLLVDFMYDNLVEGFSDNFILGENDKRLLIDLNKIGFKVGDDAAHEFLYSTIADEIKSSDTLNFRIRLILLDCNTVKAELIQIIDYDKYILTME